MHLLYKLYVSLWHTLSSVKRSSEWIYDFVQASRLRETTLKMTIHTYKMIYKKKDCMTKKTMKTGTKHLGMFTKKRWRRTKKLVDTHLESLFTRKTEINVFFCYVLSIFNVFSCRDKIIMSNRHRNAIVKGFPI